MLLKKLPASKIRPRETSGRSRPLNRTLASKSPRSLGQRLLAQRHRNALQSFRTCRRQTNRPPPPLCLFRHRYGPRPPRRNRPRTNKQLQADGLSYRKIAAKLAARGHPDRQRQDACGVCNTEDAWPLKRARWPCRPLAQRPTTTLPTCATASRRFARFRSDFFMVRAYLAADSRTPHLRSGGKDHSVAAIAVHRNFGHREPTRL